MYYSISNCSEFRDASSRSRYLSPSGLCSMCREDCETMCGVALSSALGKQTVYPITTGANQIGPEKRYPVDYSHFNINGSVFGAAGTAPAYEEAEIFNVNTETEYGRENKVRMAMPIILPAVIKLNWQDYFSGAAISGVTCVIGEDAKSKDPDLKLRNGRIIEMPMLESIFSSFRNYYRGMGQIVLQCNVEDDMQGLPEFATEKYHADAIEFKLGQAAKGIQPAIRLKDIDEALAKKARGFMVYPDPDDPIVQKAVTEGTGPNFYLYYRLPQWDEDFFRKRVEEVRQMGIKNVYLKMAGYRTEDLERVLRIACDCSIDMVTFDGAGGGSGYSPCDMINEWCKPTIHMEKEISDIAGRLKAEGKALPAIVVTGGFASEGDVFKALALGDGKVSAIGMCRAAMTAAMKGKSIGKKIEEGKIPAQLQKYGTTKEEIFSDLADLRFIYGKEADSFSTGMIGVYSFLNRIAFGLQHFSALNRKFDISLLKKEDLIPLTQAACDLLKP